MIRGKIRNEKYVNTKDYSGLRYGKITPSDIDGFLEFSNRLFVFLELKYQGATLPYGQRLAYERLVDAITLIPCYVIVGAHTAAPGDVIEAATCPVTTFYYRKEWRLPKVNGITIRQVVDILYAQHVTSHPNTPPICECCGQVIRS